MAAADALGLQQMGQAAGLSGGALDAFVASGGALGSTAAGGANVLGLYQMGADAGLSGDALAKFAAGGGTAGATVAGGGGIGTGAAPWYQQLFNAGKGLLGGALTQPTGGGSGGGGLNLNNLLGGLLQGGLGYLGADKQAEAFQNIYNQSRADRMPALGAFNTALSDPNSFYNSAPAMGATDAVLRKLSMQGNPANNPGLLSQAAAYNLGGYNDYLRALSGPAFGTAGIEAQTGMGQAQAQGGGLNAIGYGLNTAFQQPSAFDEYYRAAAKRLNTGTPTNGILGLV
jgi:hypothetical protein